MTLLTTVFAALIASIFWYKNEEARKLKVGTLSLMYWGASLMWLIDAIFEYAELGSESFVPAPLDMLNDLYLGLSVVALGLIIWLVVLLVRDPKGVVKTALFNKN
jgi:predicted secreted protein